MIHWINGFLLGIHETVIGIVTMGAFTAIAFFAAVMLSRNWHNQNRSYKKECQELKMAVLAALGAGCTFLTILNITSWRNIVGTFSLDNPYYNEDLTIANILVILTVIMLVVVLRRKTNLFITITAGLTVFGALSLVSEIIALHSASDNKVMWSVFEFTKDVGALCFVMLPFALIISIVRHRRRLSKPVQVSDTDA